MHVNNLNTGFRCWCLSWEVFNSSNLTCTLPIRVRNFLGNFTPGCSTAQVSQHHFLPEASSWVQWWSPSLWVQTGRESLKQNLLPKAPTCVPMKPGNCPLSRSQTSRLPSPCFLLCCSSHVRNPSAGIQKAMPLSTFAPHLTVPYLLQWCSADIFACLADKCFIPPPHVIVHILSFTFSLQGFFWAGCHILLGRGQWGLWLCSYKLCKISKYSTLIFLAQSSHWSAPPE